MNDKGPDLFSSAARRQQRHAPLAERMRPRDLSEFVGQAHILGPGKLLRKAIEADHVPSILLWGPPGCGKTALASVIASSTGSKFVHFSAVLGGVKEIRSIVSKASEDRDHYCARTILFIDEIHRMNKAQQDALLPHVERGTVTLIGATTENPSFEVNSALLSRTRLFVLEPLGEDELVQIIKNTLSNKTRGLGTWNLRLEQSALDFLCKASAGDARQALNTLEAAAIFLRDDPDSDGRISLEAIGQAIQKKALMYDKSGEEHYNVISAFIKSLRGSDPHAAIYWMTRMLEAGEDPRFILRRMIIFASEDVGNADPNALQVACAAMQAHEFVGLPESSLNLSQAVIYLATAHKCNSALTAYTRARKDVRELGALKVPLKLRNAPTDMMKDLNYGRDYRYPHDFTGNYTPEHYLPDEITQRRYYTPSSNGYEQEISKRLDQWQKIRSKQEDDGQDQCSELDAKEGK